MMMDDDDLDVLAGEYVLGFLSKSKTEDVERRLQHDRELRDWVDTWEDRLTPAAALALPVVPDRTLWHRIERAVKSSMAQPAALRRTDWMRAMPRLPFGQVTGAIAVGAMMARVTALRPR